MHLGTETGMIVFGYPSNLTKLLKYIKGKCKSELSSICILLYSENLYPYSYKVIYMYIHNCHDSAQDFLRASLGLNGLNLVLSHFVSYLYR